MLVAPRPNTRAYHDCRGNGKPPALTHNTQLGFIVWVCVRVCVLPTAFLSPPFSLPLPLSSFPFPRFPSGPRAVLRPSDSVYVIHVMDSCSYLRGGRTRLSRCLRLLFVSRLCVMRPPCSPDFAAVLCCDGEKVNSLPINASAPVSVSWYF